MGVWRDIIWWIAAGLFLAAICVFVVFVATTPANAGLLSNAKSYVGLHEREHRQTLKRTLGVDPARVPWCGYFLAHVVRKSGMKPPAGYGRAISWAKWGRSVPVRQARAGDIAVVRGGRHVGVVSHVSGGKVYLVGGNQSNRVRLSGYPLRGVVSIRRAP